MYIFRNTIKNIFMKKKIFMKKLYFLVLAAIQLLPMCNVAQTANQSQVVSSGGGTSSGGAYSSFAVVGEPFVAYQTSGSAYQSDDGFIYRLSDATILNLTLYIEGLFNGSGLNKAQSTTGDQFPGNIADNINIELHNASNYSNIVFSANNIGLSTAGQATVTIPESSSGSYYVTVKHRNSLETVSTLPVNFSGGTKAYNFTFSPMQAYGNNLKLLATGIYGLYTGDANADGLINTADVNLISASATSFGLGYLTNDLNGDGIVDALDLIVVDNNAANFRMKITP
jgi:hypothetical protein